MFSVTVFVFMWALLEEELRLQLLYHSAQTASENKGGITCSKFFKLNNAHQMVLILNSHGIDFSWY